MCIIIGISNLLIPLISQCFQQTLFALSLSENNKFRHAPTAAISELKHAISRIIENPKSLLLPEYDEEEAAVGSVVSSSTTTTTTMDGGVLKISKW